MSDNFVSEPQSSEQRNPDDVKLEDVLQEIQNINPVLVQLAVSNVRVAQWREFAGKDAPQENASSS